MRCFFSSSLHLFLLLLLLLVLLDPTHGFAVQKKRHRDRTPTNVEGTKGGEATADDDGEELEEQTLEGEDQAETDHYRRLVAYVRKRVSPSHRPGSLRGSDHVTDVHVAAGLYQIVDLDQRNNLATLSAYLDAWWLEPRASWNSTLFGGHDQVFMSLSRIWRPEFHVYHSIQGRVPDYAADAQVEIRSNGRVRLFVPITSRSLCPINVKYLPFDQQNCSFNIGSWSYQSRFVRLWVDTPVVRLQDFYDNQEWLLTDATLTNGTIRAQPGEEFACVTMQLHIRRQSFYHIFNLVFPTTLVSIVAVVGFHAPICASGRRESKFRLGIMTLLSMSVMLLMLVGEVNFSFESIPGQRGSFSDVPLLGIYYMSLILLISIATVTTSVFVHLEKYALRHPHLQNVPWYLRWLTARRLFCCYVPAGHRPPNVSEPKTCARVQLSEQLIPHTLNLMDASGGDPHNNNNNNNNSLDEDMGGADSDLETQHRILLDGERGTAAKVDAAVALLREWVSLKRARARRLSVAPHWERLIRRLENGSLTLYLSLIALNMLLFLYPELWY